MNSFKGRRM